MTGLEKLRNMALITIEVMGDDAHIKASTLIKTIDNILKETQS